jgi:tetratricopeptide (TPR) repeat protein
MISALYRGCMLTIFPEGVMDQRIRLKTAIHLFKGIRYCEKRQWYAAVAEFNTAIKFDSRHPYLYTCRGRSNLSMGRYDKAICNFNKAIEINPTAAAAYQNRALVYFFKGEYTKAWKDFIKVQPL